MILVPPLFKSHMGTDILLCQESSILFGARRPLPPIVERYWG